MVRIRSWMFLGLFVLHGCTETEPAPKAEQEETSVVEFTHPIHWLTVSPQNDTTYWSETDMGSPLKSHSKNCFVGLHVKFDSLRRKVVEFSLSGCNRIDGTVIAYYPSGSVAEIQEFDNGHRTGIWRTYDGRGHITSRTRWDADSITWKMPPDPPEGADSSSEKDHP